MRAAVALAFDVVLVAVFVLIGRRSHEEGGELLGFLTTFWPFLAGLLAGWALARSWRAPDRIVPTGLIVWAGTVVVGLLLRIVSQQGVQWSFVIVTALVLGAFLLGRRALTRLAARRRRR